MIKKNSFNLSNALFIIPNAFTIASIFFATYAIANITISNSNYALYQSALALYLACACDVFDGRIARLTKTQSEFGLQLDSLADVISFGVAPALLAFKWAFSSLDFWGLGIVFFYISCGAIRLARFNVINQQKISSTFFLGLPIPLASTLIASLIIAHYKIHDESPLENTATIALLIVSLSLLMISTFKFWTFKELKRSTMIIFMLLFFSVLLIGSQFTHISIVIAAIHFSYIAAGLLRTFLVGMKKFI